jgi:hypothetical protein
LQVGPQQQAVETLLVVAEQVAANSTVHQALLVGETHLVTQQTLVKQTQVLVAGLLMYLVETAQVVQAL